jgi:predicted TIM-barrel fold metal-dependent hydrolase
MTLNTTMNERLGLPADTLVIDTDTHLTEPRDLWTSRAPARYVDRVPRVEVVDGRNTWVFDGAVVGAAGSSAVIDSKGEKHLGMSFVGMSYDEVQPAAFDARARVELMDELGIWAQIVYPNTFGFGGQKFIDMPDADLRLLTVQIYNDASAEMQEASGDRLFGMAIMPWWDIDASVAEIRRCHAMGVRGVNCGTGPHVHGLPDLSQPEWDPMWDVCAELAMPVNFHIGASADTLSWFGTSPWPSHDEDTKLAIGSAMMYLSNASVMANLIFGGVLERHPEVQFVSVESGVGWIPFFLQSLDYQQQQSTPGTYGTRFSLTPTEYFQRQMHACFWFEEAGVAEAIAALGDTRVMFETDYPHPTCLYPDSLGVAETAVRSLPEQTRRRVMAENATNLYRVPVPSVAP